VISLFVEYLQLISCGISMIMGQAAVPPGQSGRNGRARARREGGERSSQRKCPTWVLSRADLVVELGLPDVAARARILAASLADLAVPWPELKDLASDDALHDELAVRTAGWDGRRLRKLPLAVIGTDPALARDPARLTARQLRSAVPA
jgi:hypothetical protein